MTVDPFKEQQIRYVDFGQLRHYLDYLNPARAERLKKNSLEDAAAGKIPNFTAYVMPFRLTENKDGFILLAEVYNPISTMSPYYSNPYYYNPYYSPYGLNPYSSGYYYPGMNRMYRPYTYGNNARNVDEIKTSETVLLSYDAKGNIMWDYSMKLDDIKMPGIEQVTDFCIQGDKVYFLFKQESELKSKTIVLKDEVSTEIVEKVKTSNPLDEIKSEREFDGGVRHWFANSFYVWGYQGIRNPTKEDKVRDVFYINKVMAK